MSQALKITVSGLRGIVGQGLTAEVALNYGSAFGAFLNSCSSAAQPLKVCVGKDSRPSGAMLGAAVTAGLCQVGVDVLDLGVVTTPGVAVMVGELN